MARARTIKPSFFSNEALAERSAMTRLCFIGLWTLADRNGVLEDRAKRIRAALFPYEPMADVPTMLDELAADGFIERYTVDGQAYIQIAKFHLHQHVHPKEQGGQLPTPNGQPPAPVAIPAEKPPVPASDDPAATLPGNFPACSGNAGSSTSGSSFPSFPSLPSGSSEPSGPAGTLGTSLGADAPPPPPPVAPRAVAPVSPQGLDHEPRRRGTGGQPPLALGLRRLKVWRWMLDDLIATLGDHADAFDVHAWLHELDAAETRVLPRSETWPYLERALLTEARRRGLPMAPSAATEPTESKATARRKAAFAALGVTA